MADSEFGFEFILNNIDVIPWDHIKERIEEELYKIARPTNRGRKDFAFKIELAVTISSPPNIEHE